MRLPAGGAILAEPPGERLSLKMGRPIRPPAAVGSTPATARSPGQRYGAGARINPDTVLE
jgi:hypothetical protein